ncbi:TetR/AcrR family transcriptional regulator [Pseudorhodoferax sp. Leaf274]|uniref:TetR/AcrR family transcriptional regulator n=1 Tax=Pseudorhodoferax sp. Leaf274 TaxID=1736318 RepID=UPI0007030B15|nr:TetR/AcrR family transcriptional regulator [Pseudorhodoferax sp. Leaf274]KQP37212.1 TetR family transcriptional regulator [Pseudorhodoferax sp. Leaf274]
MVEPSHSPRAKAAVRHARRKDARPSELLDAALDLFVEKGFAATRVEAVAARAGVSKGTLFLYFPSKEELFRAVVHENLSTRFADWKAEYETMDGSAVEMLHHALQSWWTRVGATKLTGLTKLVMSEAQNFPEVAACYHAEVVRPSQQLLRGLIQRGIDRGEFRALDAEYAVYSITSTILYLVMHKHALSLVAPVPEQLMPERYIASQLDIILHGLLQPGQAPASRIPALS